MGMGAVKCLTRHSRGTAQKRATSQLYVGPERAVPEIDSLLISRSVGMAINRWGIITIVISSILVSIASQVHAADPPVVAGAAPTTAVAPATAAPLAAEAVAWAAPNSWFLYTIPISVLVIGLLAVLFIRSALSTLNWSLADALSEEAELTAWDTQNGTKKPMLDASGKPLTVIEMRASTSRVIALMGMTVILIMYLGFGTFALFSFGKTGTMPQSIDNVVTFLISGATLFAPYLVNKFSKLFESLSPKKG